MAGRPYSIYDLRLASQLEKQKLVQLVTGAVSYSELQIGSELVNCRKSDPVKFFVLDDHAGPC